MNKEICFKINSKNLYIDEYLVELNLPIFFICKDDDNLKYAVMCVNTTTLTYVVCKVTIDSIIKMLKNILSLYRFFMSSDEKWYVQSGDTIETDTCEKLQTLTDNLLPQKNTFLDLHNDKIKTYIERLQQESNSREINYPITTMIIIKRLLIKDRLQLNIKGDNRYENMPNSKKLQMPIQLAGAVFL